MTTGDNAAGTITFINNGTTYANTRWFCVAPSPAIIGTNMVLWAEYDAPTNLGRGLQLVTIDNAPTIQVDSSLNFIQYLDNQGPDGAGTINIGTNTTNINIGKSNSVTNINGKVGIGTPTPSFTLDVSGNMRFQNGNVIWANNASGGAEQFLWPRWSDNITYLNYGSAGFNIRNNGSTSRMFITDGGNVGIGTTAPEERLDIRTPVQNNSALIMRDISNNNPLRMVPNLGAGGFNSISQNGDIGIFYGVRNSTTSSLVIAPHNDAVSGIRMIANGNVGIGRTTPAHLLDVNGTCRATTFVSGSDYRLKTNIEPLLPSRTIDELKPVEYDISGNVHDMGFIAHEVEEVLPFLVHGTKDGENMQSLNYNGFIALLVKEVQELKKNNVKLTNQILDLKKIVEKLL